MRRSADSSDLPRNFWNSSSVAGIYAPVMEVEGMMANNLFEDKKRKMKTPLQLETLEQVYAEEKYPSQAVRAQLSIQLGLSNRQVKMWFCHRRQKERKSKGDDDELGSSDKSLEHKKEAPMPPYQGFSLFPSLTGKSTFPVKEENQLSGRSCNSDDDYAWKSRRRPQFTDVDKDSPKKKSSRPAISNGADSWRVAELQAIASVEAQLGEPLRWDSPCLGIEFDPLPPGTFGSHAVPSQPWKPSSVQEVRSHWESKNDSKVDLVLQRDSFCVEKSRSRKVAGNDNGPSTNSWSSSRSLQEYQFIPERPTGRAEMAFGHERSTQVKAFPQINRQELVLQTSVLRESESLQSASGFEGKGFSGSGGGLVLQRDIYHTNMFPPPQLLHQDLLPNSCFDGHLGGLKNLHHILPPASVLHDLQKISMYNEDDVILGSKKRKSDEIKIAKEVEVYRKRMQKEAEREELARQKRLEQLQREQEKEAEKLLREKQREDERLQRERQREEERLQREARRESERLERLAQKEAQRLEREREKEEARRQKEATRLKTAIERATARRLARECVELIDDERLELLEVAAMSQGLPSIYLLDGDTLQNLDRFKDCLKKFPPPVVKMKRPLVVSPWVESQQNVGSLFMIWRFLTAFTDVLGLWPFTLDELVQAFHDFDSRLLAEIHIALFRTMVRDVEDVAKAAASSGAVNQYTAPSTIGGGHTQLVEAAFARGFDYRDWSRLLSPSTWPDILRQVGLAAGFGGGLWKHSKVVEGREFLSKGNAGVRTGNISQSGGVGSYSSAFLKPKMGFNCKVGHRLTPGTVKFAAFHVVSVADARGLSIAEIASRIEKYGLRNLTASKTPESTIAAALSRDTVFFERVAPSTYWVKPVYRKNPEDAERLIQAALEKTRLFHSGVLDAYNLEKDSDEVEREANSCDELEDIDADDMDQKSCSLTKRRDSDKFDNNARNTDSRGKHLSIGCVNGWTQDSREGEACVASLPDDEADESHGAEPWVKGLIKGEYTGLSVEERLDALVALVEVVNEGNTIRVALEERLEGATALKRQMWADAQLDKRRTKEEQLLKAQLQGGGGGGSGGMKSEGVAVLLMEDTRTASPAVDKDGGQGYSNLDALPMAGPSSLEKPRGQLKADIDFRAEQLYVFRSTPLGLDRRRNRYWLFVTSYAAEDPGCGRIFFESSEDGHWEVIDTEEAFGALMASLDMRGIREAQLLGVLQKLEGLIRQGMRRLNSFKKLEQSLLITRSEGNGAGSLKSKRSPSKDVAPSEEGSSGHGSSLPDKGVRMHKGAIQVELGISQSGKKHALRQYRDFERWFWSRENAGSVILSARRLNKKRGPQLLAKCEMCHSVYWHEEKRCSCCHGTPMERGAKHSQQIHEGETNLSGRDVTKKLRYGTSILPSRVQHLKAQMLSVEAAVPAEAFKARWTEKTRKRWASSLKHASSASKLLQSLSELESAVHQDWLPRSFEFSKDVLESAGSGKATDQSTALSWIPRTTAAVAMRLAEFDDGIVHGLEQKLRSSHGRRKAHGASKKSQSKDTAAPFSYTKEADKPLKDGAKQSSGERKHARNKVVIKGMPHTHSNASLTRDWRGSDGDVGAMEKANIIKDERGGKGKQFSSQHLEDEENVHVSKVQRVDDRDELHMSSKSGSRNLQNSADFRYEEDAFSEEEEVEEVIIEDEDHEEETGHFGTQDRRWVDANENCETYSTDEEAEDGGKDEGADEVCETYSTEEEVEMAEEDEVRDVKDKQGTQDHCKSEGSSGEEDSEDEESSDGSTDSTSSDDKSD